MSALKIGNVLRAGLMAWALFMDLNVRSGDNYVNIGQSLVGTSGAVAPAALVCLLALSWADERLPKAGLRVRLAALFLGVWQVIAVSVANTNDMNQPFLSGSQKLKAAVLALGIGVQNLPEGLAVALPFRAGGMSRGRSFALGPLSGAVEPVFGMLAALEAGMMQGALPGMMAFCAGAMMQVVFAEMAPQAAKSRAGLFALMTGYALMMALDLALG